MALFETLTRDLRYAIRVLRRTPAFTSAAVLTLALAIGANTAVFSVVDAVLLKPLPYPAADRLALVSRIVRTNGLEHQNTSVDGRTWQAVRDHAASVESAVFSSWTTGVNLVAAGAGGVQQALYVQQQRVSTGFFQTLRVAPQIGREFSQDEDRAGGPAATVLSAHLWRTLFNSDRSIVGRTIVLRGAPYEVIGVMPDGFQSGERADLWTPLRPSTTGEGGGENYQILLRLRDGTSWSQAEGELARIGDIVRQPGPETASVVSFSFVPLHQGFSDTLRQPLLMLWAAVGIVLLVACVNLAGLLFARSSQRSREIGTRMALGSGRAAVIRQLLVESLVLAAAGGALGIVAGWYALDGLTWLARDAYEIWQPVALDRRSIAAAVALSLGAGFLFGLGPALQAGRLDLQSRLVPGATRSIAGGTSRWPRRMVVVAQVALGLVLLVAAGLMLRTFVHLRGLNPGFDASNVITAAVSLEDERYRTAARVTRLFDDALLRLRQTPGVQSAAVALEVPYQRLLNLGFRRLDGSQTPAGTSGAITSASYVSTGFFEAMGIPIRQGRAFTEGDRHDSAPVVIISDAFARMYFKDEDPIGRRIAVAGAAREIVGQVGDVQVKPGWGDNGPLSAMPVAYVPVGQVNDAFMRLVHGWFAPTFIVRTTARAADAATTLRNTLDQVDPLLPFANVRPMADVRGASLAPQRFLMALLAGLAAAAVLLAAVGIHGLIASSVTERTREIGIRIALGASTAQTIRAIALPGLALAAAGIITGLVASSAAVRMLQSFVWGVSTSDPTTFILVSMFLFLVAATASIIPTLRILRLDPATTLRHD